MQSIIVLMVAACLVLLSAPCHADEPNFDVYHYTPCEVLWIENLRERAGFD